MDHATQVARIKQAFEYIDGDQAATPCVKRAPVAAYTDQQWLDREQANIVKHYPLFMVLSCVIAEPGAALLA